MKYIINDTIVFNPGEGLYLVSSETVNFKLSLVADRILFLLVTCTEVTVSKQEIQSYLLKEYSHDASSASINNNISFLRKFFKEMGVSDFIVTTPKIGISLQQGSRIQPLYEQSEIEGKDNWSGAVIVNQEKSNRVKWKLGGVIGLALSLVLFLLLSRHSASDAESYIGSVKNCKVFSLEHLSDSGTVRLMKYVNAFIDEEAVKCSESHIIIASTQDKGHKYVRGSRNFVAVCEIKKNHLYACDNYYYLGGKDEVG